MFVCCRPCIMLVYQPSMRNSFYSLQAVDLTECKAKIFEYVESRMSFIAPNLSIIVGASIAAKLMGQSLHTAKLIVLLTHFLYRPNSWVILHIVRTKLLVLLIDNLHSFQNECNFQILESRVPEIKR